MVLKACERNSAENTAESNGQTTNGTDSSGAPLTETPAKKAKLDTEETDFVEYEDLGKITTESFKNLNLTEVNRYLNGPVGDYQTDPVTQDALLQVVHHLKAFSERWTMKPQLMDAKTAQQILNDLSPSGALMRAHHREGIT
ncbi:unnamed protein product, partial [Allacma fusca]